MSENTPTPDGLTAHKLCRCQLCRDLERSCCALCKLTWPCAGYFRENAEQAWQTVIEQKAHIAALEQVIKSNEVTNDLQSENAQLRQANGELVQSLAAAEAARREGEITIATLEDLIRQHKEEVDETYREKCAAEEAAIQARQSRVIARNLLMKTERARAAAEADAARVRAALEQIGKLSPYPREGIAATYEAGYNYALRTCQRLAAEALAAAAPETVE